MEGNEVEDRNLEYSIRTDEPMNRWTERPKD